MKRTGVVLLFTVVCGAFGWAAEPSAFDAVMARYEPVRQALLADTMKDVNLNGRAIAAELRALEAGFSAERAGAAGEAAMALQEQLPAMIAAADALAGAGGLPAARDAFYELTKPLVRWREGVAAGSRPAVAYCPMHKRSWLQPGEEIGNPYGGMPRCGEIVAN